MASEELNKTLHSVGNAILLFTKTWLGAAVIDANRPEVILMVTGVDALRQRVLVDGYWVPTHALKVLALGNSTIDVSKFEDSLRGRLG